MKLLEIVRYEAGYRLRSPSTWAYAGFLLLVGVWMFLFAAEEATVANAAEPLAWSYVRPGILGILVTAALFGGAAVRDIRAGMDPLLYTAPVTPGQFLGGRYLGALAVNTVLLLAIPLGALVGSAILARVDPAALGPFRAAVYLEPYLVFLVPNTILIGAVLFAVGALSRHVVPVYLAGIGLLIGYVVVLNYASHIESPLVAGLVDPLGLVTLERVTRYWTEAERSSRLIGLPASLAWNRGFWLLAAAGVLGLLRVAFRFAHHEGGGRRRNADPVTAPVPRAGRTGRADPVEVPRVAGKFGVRTTVRQTLAVARNALAEAAPRRWFAVVLAACVGLPLLWGWNVGTTVFDTSTWPVTLLVTEEVLAQRSVILFIALVVVFAGELVWKDRDVGAQEIKDAAPVTDGVAVLGRFLALVVLIVAFQAAATVGGLLIQTLQGYTRFEPLLYLQVVFGLKLADYVLLAAMATTLHVLVNHRNLGHVTVLVFLLLLLVAPRLLGIQHSLLIYGSDPGWAYSDMNGFGPFAEPLVWFRLYWGAWALLLLVLAGLFQVRGPEAGMRRRLRQARRRLTGLAVRTAAVAVALILVFGGFVFYNTNILNEYRSDAEQDAPRVEYERRYGRYHGRPQPVITAAELRVDLHPYQRTVDLRGVYTLVNRTATPIDSIHVSLDPDAEPRAMTLERAEAVRVDEEVGFRTFALERPLAPGDSVRLTFDVALRRRGFPARAIPTDVVANGTSINRRHMPLIGYQRLVEVSDPDARQEYGLPPRARPGPGDAADATHRWATTDADLVHVDAILSTTEDQVAVTSGALRRSWSENGRRYFHYVTETPVALGGGIISGRFALREGRWNDVRLRVYHHPDHQAVLDRVLASMKASLSYLTDRFGPYPYGELNVVETPRYGGFGAASPYVITFTEDFFFSRVREGQVDQPFYGIAHEVAHTWWGGLVRGAPVGGAGFLSESLANYSAMLITEQTYGPEAGRRLYDFQMERYLRGRALQGDEVPVLEVEDQPYVAYRKGALALYTLRDHIGEEAVNGAVRRYFQRFHHDDGPPYPSSLDLYAELRAATPDSLHPMLTDWFETITLWDVRTERAAVERTDAGEYVVALDVIARKVRADSAGNETEVPMDDLVELGVYEVRAGAGPAEPMYLERHRLRSGRQTISVTVPREPARAGVDPRRRLIDRNRGDDLVGVEFTTSAPRPPSGGD